MPAAHWSLGNGAAVEELCTGRGGAGLLADRSGGWVYKGRPSGRHHSVGARGPAWGQWEAFPGQ